MSEGKRLRELAAEYLRVANFANRADIREWVWGLAADALKRAEAFENQGALIPDPQSEARPARSD
jgi:hypothetical protein